MFDRGIYNTLFEVRNGGREPGSLTTRLTPVVTTVADRVRDHHRRTHQGEQREDGIVGDAHEHGSEQQRDHNGRDSERGTPRRLRRRPWRGEGIPVARDGHSRGSVEGHVRRGPETRRAVDRRATPDLDLGGAEPHNVTVVNSHRSRNRLFVDERSVERAEVSHPHATVDRVDVNAQMPI